MSVSTKGLTCIVSFSPHSCLISPLYKEGNQSSERVSM